MFGHNDFPLVQKTWDDFWKGKNKGPVYAITIPKNGKKIEPLPPYLSWFHGGFAEAADTLARWYESAEFYGVAVPGVSISFGADDFAAFIGSDLVYAPQADGSITSWAAHVLEKILDTDIHFDPNGKWWNKIAEFHCVLKRRLGDTVMISPPTLSAGLDALSALRGPENLLIDLMDDPESVHRALDQINNTYTAIHKACVDLFEIEKYGSVTRHGAYSTGYITVVQCDFSCMISPALFEEFGMKALNHEFSFVKGSEYHLDGPDALKHLDRLLKIPELNIVQWVPGAGFGESQDWTELYKRIVKSGKGLILGGSVERAKSLPLVYKTKNLFIPVYGIKTQTEAEDFLAGAAKAEGAL